MATADVSARLIENAGSLTLHIITFSDIDDGDEYDSNMQGIVGYWANRTDTPTQTKEGIDVSLSTDTFTFHTGEANCTGQLFILSQS